MTRTLSSRSAFLRDFNSACGRAALVLTLLCVPSAMMASEAAVEGTSCQDMDVPCRVGEMDNWALIDTPAQGDTPAALSVGIYSDAPVSTLFDRQDFARLSVTCSENRTSLRLRFPGNVLSDVADYGKVMVGLDNEDPREVLFSRAETDDTLGLMIGSQAVPFVVQLMGARSVQLSVTSLADRPLEASFSLAGLGAAMVPLRRACNW
ncbi:type VI secretion system (T6SS) VasI/EvfG family protein [Rhodobacter aestuarii]|uniref:Type VI secretion system VasI, EvfG, VC_A0118 n=2 Tax=Rhodobacter aestuarii TaxID=453582 RepID=A0A1N7MT63_9RHOB|nr:type VI secretion system-associated protein TagO [Rhodobacter aestuarii]PTV96551.1 type VI secretion system (T6SS) VasI/EvfG family protein [Rhodobacter aestuarii]SIS89296.1 Type VI secretion system VasI, EvfG, VC_A0118 [Rhodobacter aestuarii]